MAQQAIAEHWSYGECDKQRRGDRNDVSKGERRKHSGRKTRIMISVAKKIEFLISLEALKITLATGSGVGECAFCLAA